VCGFFFTFSEPLCLFLISFFYQKVLQINDTRRQAKYASQASLHVSLKLSTNSVGVSWNKRCKTMIIDKHMQQRNWTGYFLLHNTLNIFGTKHKGKDQLEVISILIDRKR